MADPVAPLQSVCPLLVPAFASCKFTPQILGACLSASDFCQPVVLHAGGQTSSSAMLAHALLHRQATQDRARVSLFHTPALRGLLKRYFCQYIVFCCRLSQSALFSPGTSVHLWSAISKPTHICFALLDRITACGGINKSKGLVD